MKILVTTHTDDEGVTRQKLFINGKHVESIGGGEPEDNCIGRDLVAATTISEYMQQAFEAGRQGEEIDIEVRAVEDREELWDD